jgi:aryl-alcohol dehydrogenase-like predicted oxidoreductase
MANRTLGNSGIEVSPLAFGGNVFGWSIDEATSHALLDGFIHAGFNFIDTADMYSVWVPGNKGGESETIIGKWLRKSGKRGKVIIATKVGLEMGAGKKGLSKAYILRAAEDSLRRLQTDVIDLYQSHTDDNTTPLDETLEAYSQLIKQGKVRAIGASNYSAPRLKEALEVSKNNGLPSYQTLQPHYNLYDRADFEAELEPLCLKENIGVISYFSLARGFLSGKYRSEKDLSKSAARGAGVKQYLDARGMRILDALDALALEYHTTPASIALAWLLARKSVTAPIVSATSLKQLDELIASTSLELNAEAIQQLDAASNYNKAKGAAA